MVKVTSLTWTIILTVVAGVAAAPPVAVKVHAWFVKVFRLNESRADFLREFVQWGYVTVVLLLGCFACVSGECERHDADADIAAREAKSDAQIETLGTEVKSLYQVVVYKGRFH